jgi:hypothetical protein
MTAGRKLPYHRYQIAAFSAPGPPQAMLHHKQHQKMLVLMSDIYRRVIHAHHRNFG